MKLFSSISKIVSFLRIYIGIRIKKLRKDGDYEGLFNIACKFKNIFAMKFLIKEGAKLDKQNEFDITPLEVACIDGDVKFAATLIEHGANVNKISYRGNSLLDIALENKNKDLTELLLNNFAKYSLLDNKQNPIIQQLLNNPSVEIKTRVAIETKDVDALENALSLYYESVCGDESKMKIYLDCIRKNLLNTVDVSELIKVINDFTINRVGFYSENLLKEAWECKNMKAVETLSKKMDITVLNESCDLLEACESGNFESIDLLLAQGMDINDRKIVMDTKGKFYVINPLIIACVKNDVQLVQYLIDNGANVNEECYNMGTPLDIALRNENISLTKLLIENFAKIDIMKEQEGENKQLMQQLFNELSLDIVIRIMIQEKNVDGFRECLKLLGYEVILRQHEINIESKLKNLISNIKQEIENINDYDIQREMIYAVRCFENSNIDFNKSKIDLLVEACLNHDIYGVDFLIEKGVDINRANEEGTTPLIAACYAGNITIVERLVELGANIDKEGCVYNKELMRVVCEGTPLIVATKMKKSDIVASLVERGADIDKRYEFGKTALIYAVENESEDIVKTLIDNGANINVVPMDKNTALMIVARNGNENIAKYLLDNNVKIEHELYEKAFNIAVKNKDINLVRLFMDKFTDWDMLEKETEGKYSKRDIVGAKIKMENNKRNDNLVII